MGRFFEISVSGTPVSETILVQALEHMRSKMSNQLQKMKDEKQFIDVDWNMLNEYLPEKLVQEMDARRNTTIHRKLSSALSYTTTGSAPVSRAKPTTTDIELLETSNIHETVSTSNAAIIDQQNVSDGDFVLPVFDFRATDTEENQSIRKELITRFLTALSVDYEKQWYLGMIRRRTLYILIKSVEKAKNQHSLKLHWDLLIKQFRLSLFLQYLMRFDYVKWINKQFNKLLFDHIFLTIELALGEY